jgi:hypothetical protein
LTDLPPRQRSLLTDLALGLGAISAVVVPAILVESLLENEDPLSAMWRFLVLVPAMCAGGFLATWIQDRHALVIGPLAAVFGFLTIMASLILLDKGLLFELNLENPFQAFDFMMFLLPGFMGVAIAIFVRAVVEANKPN